MKYAKQHNFNFFKNKSIIYKHHMFSYDVFVNSAKSFIHHQTTKPTTIQDLPRPLPEVHPAQIAPAEIEDDASNHCHEHE